MSHPGIMKKIYSESKKYRTFIDFNVLYFINKNPYLS